MKQAFIFHGTAGNPQGNWFPWLKQQLEARGLPTVVPAFPTPEGESLRAWFDVIDSVPEKIDAESLLIGHSKGGMFLLKVLERLEQPVEMAIFVSSPVGVKPIFYYDEDKKFSNFEFDWAAIKNKVKHVVVFHSDNDPYICLENGTELAEHLGVELTFIPGAGHLNTESGYTQFPQLLAAIDQHIQNIKE